MQLAGCNISLKLGCHGFDVGRDPVVGHPSRSALRFGIADPKKEPVAPSLEPAGVAQPADVPPDIEEGLLGGVLRQSPIAQDACSLAAGAP